MAYKSVNIFLSDWFDYSFNYPTGITILNDEIYVVDCQNNLVKVFDLSGTFQRQFSGTLNFPENITNDGTYLYVTDWANHRIVQLNSTGSVINTFGSIGTGNSNFTYPRGIYYKDGLLYIADTQNSRIKIHQTDGTFIAEITG